MTGMTRSSSCPAELGGKKRRAIIDHVHDTSKRIITRPTTSVRVVVHTCTFHSHFHGIKSEPTPRNKVLAEKGVLRMIMEPDTDNANSPARIIQHDIKYMYVDPDMVTVHQQEQPSILAPSAGEHRRLPLVTEKHVWRGGIMKPKAIRSLNAAGCPQRSQLHAQRHNSKVLE